MAMTLFSFFHDNIQVLSIFCNFCPKANITALNQCRVSVNFSLTKRLQSWLLL